MPITYSDRSRFALAINASSSLSKTTCVTPARSLTSMNSRPPRSRTRCTHPSSTTSAPTSSGRRAPQVCVRVNSPSCSATLLQFLHNRRAGTALFVSVLGLRREMFDRQGAVRNFVASEDGDERDPSRISVLDLLADLVSVWIDEHTQARCAQGACNPRRMRHITGVKDGNHDVGRRGRQ